MIQPISNPVVNSLILQLQGVQSGKIWLGTNFAKKLSLLDEDAFFEKPNNLNSIAELVFHLTVWRKDAIIKITSGKGSITDKHPSNWPGNKALQKLGWDLIINDYQASLSRLIDLLISKPDDFLDELYYDIDFKGNYPYSFALFGLLHHDIYHLGQIATLIRLLENKKKRVPE